MSRKDWSGSYIVRISRVGISYFEGHTRYMSADGMSFTEEDHAEGYHYLSPEALIELREFNEGDVVEVGMEFERYTVVGIEQYALSPRVLAARLDRIEKHLGLTDGA